MGGARITAGENESGPRSAKADAERVRAARKAIGDTVQLYVDANGGYTRKQALGLARSVRKKLSPGLRSRSHTGPGRPAVDARPRSRRGWIIAAGEYGYDPVYFRRMVEAGAVDILQADATRCLGIQRISASRGSVRGALPSTFRAHCAHHPCARAARSFPPTTLNISTITRASSKCFSTELRAGNGNLRPI